MPAPDAKTYVIAQVAINDRDEYDKYESADHLAIIAKFGGKPVALDEETESIEGSWPFTRTIILEFPTKDLARSWYDSDEYQAVVGFRHRAAETNIVLVSSLPGAFGVS